MPTIKLLARAESEVISACTWYENKQKGLSAYFRSDLRKTLNFIELNPNIYSKRYNTDLHFAPLNKFPFVVVYWFDEPLSTVFIISVFNTNRNTGEFSTK